MILMTVKEMGYRLDIVMKQLSEAGYNTQQHGFIWIVDEISELIESGTDLVEAEKKLTMLEMAAHSYTLYAATQRPLPSSGLVSLKDGDVVTVTPVTNEIAKALCVLVWTSHTREYLHKHDPKALEQADKALKNAGYNPACGWDTLDEEGE